MEKSYLYRPYILVVLKRSLIHYFVTLVVGVIMQLNITNFTSGLYNYPFGCNLKDNEKVLYYSQKAWCRSGKDLAEMQKSGVSLMNSVIHPLGLRGLSTSVIICIMSKSLNKFSEHN